MSAIMCDMCRKGIPKGDSFHMLETKNICMDCYTKLLQFIDNYAELLKLQPATHDEDKGPHCLVCDKAYLKKRSNQLYCSSKCMRYSNNHKGLITYPAQEERIYE